jgi:hypothetical protein
MYNLFAYFRRNSGGEDQQKSGPFSTRAAAEAYAAALAASHADLVSVSIVETEPE